jgi:HTH-type transcriptional regulator, sugar sensing transcriptional regulator
MKKKMTFDTKPLENIGLTKSEIKVYLALLKIGQSTAGQIVDESKVTRSKIYDILERLKNKGLVSHIFKSSVKYFSAATPETILTYLDSKEVEIREDKKAIHQILPQLIIQSQLSKNSKIAEVFIGVKGMDNAFHEMEQEFNPKDVFYAFGAGKGENVKQIQLFFTRLNLKRIEKKVQSRIIFNESSRGLFQSQEKSKLVQVRYLMNSTPAAINIYKDITIIAILNEEPITILIRNDETAKSFKEYFNVMWNMSKK